MTPTPKLRPRYISKNKSNADLDYETPGVITKVKIPKSSTHVNKNITILKKCEFPNSEAYPNYMLREETAAPAKESKNPSQLKVELLQK